MKAELWKRVLNEGISFDEERSWIPDAIISAPIIVDDRPEEIRNPEARLATGLTFPFERFWLEGGYDPIPKTALKPNPPINERWGVLVCAQQSEAGFEVDLWGHYSNSRSRPSYVGGMRMHTDKQGNVLNEKNPTIWLSANVLDRYGTEAAKRMCILIYSLTVDSLEMLGCKNVSLNPHANDPAAVKRAIKRHGGIPDSYRYHTLVVRPPGARHDAPAQEIGIMPRHRCRGHYSEYGPQFGKGLLFGKFSGRFYIPPHLKGLTKNGTVEKDYVIRAPQQADAEPSPAA